MNETTIIMLDEKFRTTVDDYIEYIRSIKARSPNTTAAYFQDLNCFSRYIAAEGVNFPTLNHECITSYLYYLRHTKLLKPATVRRRILTLQGLCKWLVESNKLCTNPFDDLPLDLKVPKRLPRPVDPLIIRRLVLEGQPANKEALGKRCCFSRSRVAQRQTTLYVIQLILVTGIRVGEVSAIRLMDITSNCQTIHILGKGNKERLVYIENTELAESLAEYRRERALTSSDKSFLFVNGRGKPLTPQVIRKRMKSTCERIGMIDAPTPHRFRHSAATLLIENGVDIRVVQRLLGHASISTTELYTQVSDVSLRESLRKANVLQQFQ